MKRLTDAELDEVEAVARKDDSLGVVGTTSVKPKKVIALVEEVKDRRVSVEDERNA